jgi:hypothetical protein
MANRGNPTWKPGQSGNPNGRPPKGNTVTEQLEAALAKAAKKHKHTFIEHLVDLAYEHKDVAVALAKKILPDLKSVELANTGDSSFRLLIQLPTPEPPGHSDTDAGHSDIDDR